MNKRIDFTKLGGYPLAQEDLDWLQESYRGALAAMADFIGDKVILKGMVEAGGAVTAGWISIAGELVPFEAGNIGTGEFIIDELITPLVFNDANSKDVLYNRVAKFSAGGGNAYTDLKRLPTLKTGLVPSGAIVMWSGIIADIPASWYLCDGTNGTPNLSGKFIAGYDAGDADYDAIGKTGGAKAYTLTAGEQGHIVTKEKVDDIGGGGTSAVASLWMNGTEIPKDGGSNQSSFGTAVNIPLTAATDAHPTRPPFYTLAYIMFKP